RGRAAVVRLDFHQQCGFGTRRHWERLSGPGRDREERGIEELARRRSVRACGDRRGGCGAEIVEGNAQTRGRVHGRNEGDFDRSEQRERPFATYEKIDELTRLAVRRNCIAGRILDDVRCGDVVGRDAPGMYVLHKTTNRGNIVRRRSPASDGGDTPVVEDAVQRQNPWSR